jgi:outer membrane biogenesis lipoprotein LolB
VAILNQVPVSQRMHGAARHWLFAVLAGAVLAACSKPAPAPTSESNETVEGRARNRRVELACTASH